MPTPPPSLTEQLAAVSDEFGWAVEATPAALLKLHAEIRDLETQLSDPNRTDSGGRRLSGRAYQRWRLRTVKLLGKKLTIYRLLKQQLADEPARRLAHAIRLLALTHDRLSALEQAGQACEADRRLHRAIRKFLTYQPRSSRASPQS